MPGPFGREDVKGKLSCQESEARGPRNDLHRQQCSSAGGDPPCRLRRSRSWHPAQTDTRVLSSSEGGNLVKGVRGKGGIGPPTQPPLEEMGLFGLIRSNGEWKNGVVVGDGRNFGMAFFLRTCNKGRFCKSKKTLIKYLSKKV